MCVTSSRNTDTCCCIIGLQFKISHWSINLLLLDCDSLHLYFFTRPQFQSETLRIEAGEHIIFFFSMTIYYGFKGSCSISVKRIPYLFFEKKMCANYYFKTVPIYSLRSKCMIDLIKNVLKNNEDSIVAI